MELGKQKVTCPTCKRRFKQLGKHWSNKPSHRSDIDSTRMDILTGILMGDGNIDRRGEDNPRMRVMVINLRYLKWLDEKLGWMSSSVCLSETADESARRNRESGFDENAVGKNYHDMYALRTITHPDLSSLSSWYSSGGKRYPDDLELNPTILKHWFVTDGGLKWNKLSRNAHIAIGCKNESDRPSFIRGLFDCIGFSSKWNSDSIVLPTSETDKFLRYIGGPVPGFEYKWENKRKNIYKRLKEDAYEQEYEQEQKKIDQWL